MDRETLPSDQTVPQSSDTDREILPTLLRCRDRHQWSWNLTMRLINLYYGTHYTEKQLKSLYKAAGG